MSEAGGLQESPSGIRSGGAARALAGVRLCAGGDLDGEAISARYFAGRGDGLTARGGLGRLACAWRE
jgi:hypothetical protein